MNNNRSTWRISTLSNVSSYTKRPRDSFFDCLQEQKHTDINVRVVNAKLTELVGHMERAPQRAIRELRKVVQTLSDSEEKRQWLMEWTDARHMDLLHCAIIANKPAIIQFLLCDAELFPPNYFPKLNPYAHFAASIGNKECLEELLNSRPGDDFKCSQPCHTVRIPPDVVRRYKLNANPGMADRRLKKLVDEVRELTDAKRLDDCEVRVKLEDELKKLEASFKEKTKKPNRVEYKSILPPIHPENSNNPSKTEMTEKTPSRLQDLAASTTGRKGRLGRTRESKITVYWDVFKEDALNRDTMRKGKTVATIDPKSPQNQLSKPIADHPRTIPPAQTHIHRKSAIEMGVRTMNKYKTFIPVFKRNQIDKITYMHMTPLSIAAERNDFEIVSYLLKKHHADPFSKTVHLALTMAVQSRCPEALAILINDDITFVDYQSAVQLALREMFPDSLSILLQLGGKFRARLFQGQNLFHILYGHPLSESRYTMLPEMTRVLINCCENVNAKSPIGTYPLYTLVQSVFAVENAQNFVHYQNSLKLLLDAKADTNFVETKDRKRSNSNLFIRPLYTSLMHCIIQNAVSSISRFEHAFWPQIILHKFVETVEMYDQTPRRPRRDILYVLMQHACRIGLNRRVLRIILRYGADPDFTYDGQAYALNAFFDNLIPFMARFEVKRTMESDDDILTTLLILCRAMSQSCLHQSVRQFLNAHLLTTPVQALNITRNFCYHANKMITMPRSLSHIAAQFIWRSINMNTKNLHMLPIPEAMQQHIHP